MAYIAHNLQTQERQKKLKEVFQEFDGNGDGVLQRHELLDGYMRLGKSRHKAEMIVDDIFKNIDLNHNGSIDYTEFLMANVKKDEALSQEKLKEAFRLFDKV